MNKRKKRAIDILFESLKQAEKNLQKETAEPQQPVFYDLNDLKDTLGLFLKRQKNRSEIIGRIQTLDDLARELESFKSDQLKKLVHLSEKKKNVAMRQLAMIELARRDFWWYCRLKAPNFYRENRIYLKKLCRTLQDFYAGDDMVLLINLPPRHGKSYTLSLFTEWVFGIDVSAKIMTASYNKTLSTVFSKTVRNDIQEKKASDDIVVYSDIFPGSKIKRGDSAMHLWSLEGAYSSYLATSPEGTATGFGASLELIDDLVKNHYEASNEALLEGQQKWFSDTMLSRLERGGKIIIVMTRWASGDLAGWAKEHFESIGTPVRCVEMKALQNDGTMLCDDILTRDKYEMLLKTMSPEIVAANYQQEPIDVKGRLYSQGFKTYGSDLYDQLCTKWRGVYAYVDTADEGSDYLCAYVFGVYNHEAYILDVIYTQEGMEVTEELTARKLDEHRVKRAEIESNNGGRGFARSVLRYLQTVLHNYVTTVDWFHQSKNKKARIISNAWWVMQHVYFPENWGYRWPELYKHLHKYQRDGKNQHDDAEDALSGVAEMIEVLKL